MVLEGELKPKWSCIKPKVVWTTTIWILGDGERLKTIYIIYFCFKIHMNIRGGVWFTDGIWRTWNDQLPNSIQAFGLLVEWNWILHIPPFMDLVITSQLRRKPIPFHPIFSKRQYYPHLPYLIYLDPYEPPLTTTDMSHRRPPPTWTTADHHRSEPPSTTIDLNHCWPPPFWTTLLNHRRPPPF